MSAKWKQFTQEELQDMAYKVKSNTAWTQLMGYAGKGGNTTSVVKSILEYYPDIDISHFTGQAWNKGQDSYDKLSSEFKGKRETILRALVNKRGHRCEICHQTVWLEQPIPLEVHHKDGNNTNNDVDNLELVCPNCHALTDFYRGKNINTGKEKISDEDFVKALKENSNIHQALLSLNLTAKGANYSRAYDLIDKFNIEHLK